MRFSMDLLYHFLKTKFESMHINGPDDHASDDYFAHQMNLYQGSDHPQTGYRCEGETPKESESWRFGTGANDALFQQAIDADGNFDINLVAGVENFDNTVLFIAGECQTVIGAEWQQGQMEFFPSAELTIIPDAGHEMFLENPEASIEVVRAYLKTPLGE